MVTIPVPSQPKLHKQWCLFDQSDNIDFDREVRKIASTAEESFEKTENDREGRKITSDAITLNDREVNTLSEAAKQNLEQILNGKLGKIARPSVNDLEKREPKSLTQKSKTSFALNNEDTNNFISQLTLLDVQSPVKRALQPLFEDFGQIQEFARGVKEKEKISMKNKRNSKPRGSNQKQRNKKAAKHSRATVQNRKTAKTETSKTISRNKH